MAPDALDIANITAGRAMRPFVTDGIGFLPLSRGLWAAVDEADFDAVASFKWSATVVRGRKKTPYALRQVEKTPKQKFALLHREIMAAPAGVVIDHWNGDGVDNRRINLRRCTQSENVCNHRVTGGASRYIGVAWDESRGLWVARVSKGGHTHHVGRFDDEVQAAIARDGVAIELHGAFARLNFPEAAL